MTLAVPAWYAKLLTRIAPAKWLPFNADQVTMSQEDSTCEMGKFTEDFGWMPREFGRMVEAYKEQLNPA